MPRLISVDPGTTQSSYVLTDGGGGCVIQHGTLPNAAVEQLLKNTDVEHFAVEMISSYGAPVGEEVFETCLWIGRFIGAFNGPHTKIKRHEIKMHLCHTMKGINDSAIRQRLIDLYGGKEKAIGNKKSPGPLYGFHGDQWAALAVANVWWDRQAFVDEPLEPNNADAT